MAAKAESFTAPTLNKSVTVGIKESTLEAANAAAAVVGATKDATFSVVGAAVVQTENEEFYPYNITFNWSETV